MATQTQHDEKTDDIPVIAPGYKFDTIGTKIDDVVLGTTPKGWFVGFGLSFIVLQALLLGLTWLLYEGIGTWGVAQPVGWGFDIINFVWWIGIGHAGTLISAILLLFHQQWRTSINRFAEAMTLFAVACAGLYPLAHMGRPWFFYYLLPYPNTMQLWPQFRSPLIWDVFAVSTYLTVSLLFWYTGLIPDLASIRDKAKNIWIRRIYGVLSLGWRGAAKHWHRYENAYLILAGLSTPLVLSVHTIVSFDFAVGNLPGWHATIFPPYFVAGAVFSGFAMVITLAVPARAAYGMKDFITDKHMDNMAKVMLVTGLMVFYGYGCEAFFAFYSANPYEHGLFMQNRAFGPYGIFYWLLILCNGIIPQLLWLRSVRLNIGLLFVISIIVNIGMWLERFVILMSLQRDFLPSSWGQYSPTIWDITTYIGTFGLFGSLMFLFMRFVPMISAFEMKHLIPESHVHHHEKHGEKGQGQGHAHLGGAHQ